MDEQLAQIQADLQSCRPAYQLTEVEGRVLTQHVPWLVRQVRIQRAETEMWRQRCLRLAERGPTREETAAAQEAVEWKNRRASRVSESALEAARDARVGT